MKLTLTVLLMLCLASSVFLTACSMFVKEQQATSSDGTPLFIDNTTGKATAEATDAKGVPNEPLLRSEDTGLGDTITRAGSSIPGPIGAVIGVVGSLAGAGLAEYLRRKNAATNAAIAEYETKIRANPEVAKAVDEKVWDNLSPATAKRLEPIGA